MRVAFKRVSQLSPSLAPVNQLNQFHARQLYLVCRINPMSSLENPVQRSVFQSASSRRFTVYLDTYLVASAELPSSFDPVPSAAPTVPPWAETA